MAAETAEPTPTVPTATVAANAAIGDTAQRVVVNEVTGVTRGRGPREPEHSTALHAAIETMVPLLAKWLDELDPDDASRPDRAEELRPIRQLAVGLEGEHGGSQ
jgi:hypothetical protein